MTSPLPSSYNTSNVSSSYYTPLSSTQHLATSTPRALNRYSLPPSPMGYSTQSLQGSSLHSLTTPSPQHFQPYATPTPPLSPSSHLPPPGGLVSQAKEHIASLTTQNRAVLDRITRLHHTQSQLLTNLTTSVDSKAPGSLGGGTSSIGMGSLGGGTSSGGWGLGSTTGSTTGTDSEFSSSVASASALQALRHRESEPWLRASHWDSDAASSTHSLPLAYQNVPAYGYPPQQQLQPSESDHGERARRAEVRDAVLARLSAEKGRLNGMLDGTGGSVNSINSMTSASSAGASATQYTNNIGSGAPAGSPLTKPNQETQLDSRYFDGGMQDGDDDEATGSYYTADRDDTGPRDDEEEVGLEVEDVDDEAAERARRRYSGLPPVRATPSPQPPTTQEEDERKQQEEQEEQEEEEEERGRARIQRQTDVRGAIVSHNSAAQLAPPSPPRKRGDRSTSASGRSPKLQPMTTVTPPPAAPADNGSPSSTPLSSRASSRTRSRMRYGMSDVPEDEEDTDTGYENPSAAEEMDRGEESCFEVDEEVRVIMRGQPQHPSQQRSPGSTASVTTGGSGGTVPVLVVAGAKGSKVPIPRRSASASSGQEAEPKSTSMVVSKSTSSGYKSSKEGDRRQRALAMANAAIVSPRRSLQGYRPAGLGNGGEVEEEVVAASKTQQDSKTVAKAKVARVGGGESGGQRTRTGIGTVATTQEQGGAGAGATGVGVGAGAGAGARAGAGAGAGAGGARKSGVATQRNDDPMSPVTSDGNRSETAATGSEAVWSPGTEEDPFWDEIVVLKSRIRRLEHEHAQTESEPDDAGAPVSPGSGQQRPHGHQKQISLDSSITSPRMRASSGGRNLETTNGGGYELTSRAGTPSSARMRRTSLTSTALSSEIYMPHNMRSVSRMESPVPPSYRPSSTAHQKHLQDAFEVFERAMSTPAAGSSAASLSSSQASSPGLGANGKSAEANMAHTMATIVSTALALNQTLRSITASEINTASGVLLSMQKTSDEQVRSLTESLLVLSERGIGSSSGADRTFTRDRERERRRRTISGADSAASIRGGLLIPEPIRDDDQPPRPATVTGMLYSRGASPYYNGAASPPPDQLLNGRLSERRRYAEQLSHERTIAPPQPLVYRNDRLSPPQQDSYFDELPSPRASRNSHLQSSTDTLSPTGRKRSTSFTTGRRDADSVARHASPPLVSPSASSVKSVNTNITVIPPASNASPATTPRYSARAARILSRLSPREPGTLSPTPPAVSGEAPPTPQPTRSTSLTSSDRPGPTGLSSYRRYEPLRPPADDIRSPSLRPSMQLEASRKAAAEMGYDLMNTNVRGEGTGVVVQGDGARVRRARRWSSLEGTAGMLKGVGDVSVRHDGAQQETKAGVTAATGSRVRTVSVMKRGKAMGGRVTEEEEGW